MRSHFSSQQRPVPLYLQRHVLVRAVGALVLTFCVIPVLGEYVFNEVEVANIADVELPLPRPFDTTACGLQHLAQQHQLMLVLQQLQPHAARQLLQDESVKALYEAQQSGLVAEEALRLVEFGRQAKVTLRIKLHNAGASAASAFYFVLPYFEATQLGWVNASTPDGASLSVEAVPRTLPRISTFMRADWVEKNLLVEVAEKHLVSASEGLSSFESACWPQVFKLHLAEQLDASKTTQVQITYLLGRPYRPLPRAVDLESIQSVIFATSSNWPIPYRTLRSSVTIRLPPQTTLGAEGERRMREKSFRQVAGELWTWESKSPIGPLATVKPFVVVFPLPLHLGYIFSMERLVVAPLQGSVAYEDLYKVHNDAAFQKGAYNPTTMAQLLSLPPGVSRLAIKSKDVPRGQRVPTHILFDLYASLPPDVFDLDVGDMAGNLTSTFAFREEPEEGPSATKLEVWPRYPVLGGWNFDLRVKYKVPVNSLLQQAPGSNTWSLRIPIEPPFQDLYAEDISLTVALPIGATNIHYSSPVALDVIEETSLCWWLDIFTSRPALRLRWHSTSPSPRDAAKRELVVTYDYPYPVDLEWLKDLLFIALLAMMIGAATVLYLLKLRFCSPGEAEAYLQGAAAQAAKELRGIAAAAISAGQAYIDSVTTCKAGRRSGSTCNHKEAEDCWREAVLGCESATDTAIGTSFAARRLRLTFTDALSRHREAVETLVVAVRGSQQSPQLEEAQRRVELARLDLQDHANPCAKYSSREHMD